jgi:hypothetical protein
MRLILKLVRLLHDLSGETRLKARIQAHQNCQTTINNQIKAAMTDMYDGITRCC